MASSCGATASSARAIRSSLSNSGAMPYASSTAIAAAHSCTRSIGAGAVSRLATSASITSPWEIQATGRTGHSSSMISAIRSLRPNSATTGSAPSRFSSTRTTATSARARPRPRPVLDIPLMPWGQPATRPAIPHTPPKAANDPAVSYHPAATRIQSHVRRPGSRVRLIGICEIPLTWVSGGPLGHASEEAIAAATSSSNPRQAFADELTSSAGIVGTTQIRASLDRSYGQFGSRFLF